MALDTIDYGAGQDSLGDIYDKVNLTIDAVNGITADNTLLTKVVSIGDWDMDTDSLKTVAHGIADFTKIRQVEVVIIDDTASRIYDIDAFTAGTDVINGGVEYVDSTNVSMRIKSGGIFDSTSFNATSYNRGWITIIYTV